MSPRNVIFIILALILIVAGCARANPPAPTSTSAQIELTVAAAADLQFAFSEIADLYEAETGNKVKLVFGSTGQLTQQIESGAPFDLIAAANIEYIERLLEQELVIPDSTALYARGRIVLAVNRQSGVQATSLTDLLNQEIKHIAIANPEHAPYGVAARQALQAAGVWEQIQEKLVLGENVRQALQYVQTGDATAAIVALSVANVPEIDWTLIDDSLHEPLDQALAVLTSTKHEAAGREFALFINGHYGRPVMQKYGFVLPGEAIAMVTPQP